jgi:hypothetical protein
MVAFPKGQNAGAGAGFDPFLGPLVEHAFDRAGDHVAMKVETRRHANAPHLSVMDNVMLPNCLRIGWHGFQQGRNAFPPLVAPVHPVYA